MTADLAPDLAAALDSLRAAARRSRHALPPGVLVTSPDDADVLRAALGQMLDAAAVVERNRDAEPARVLGGPSLDDPAARSLADLRTRRADDAAARIAARKPPVSYFADGSPARVVASATPTPPPVEPAEMPDPDECPRIVLPRSGRLVLGPGEIPPPGLLVLAETRSSRPPGFLRAADLTAADRLADAYAPPLTADDLARLNLPTMADHLAAEPCRMVERGPGRVTMPRPAARPAPGSAVLGVPTAPTPQPADLQPGRRTLDLAEPDRQRWLPGRRRRRSLPWGGRR